jgi:hypothetical protein
MDRVTRRARDVPRALIGAVVAVVVVALGVGIGLAVHHSPQVVQPAPATTHGFDVSWPQCSGTSSGHVPAGSPSYVILGLTHGAGNTVNPCLGSQLDWAKSHGVRVGAYLVPSHPTKAQRALSDDGLFGTCVASARCELRNNGAAQAQAAIATMQGVGLHPPRVWIDVELGTSRPWSPHIAANVALLRGVVAGLRAAHLPIGVYTTGAMWTQIAGSFRLNVPNWLPSGDASVVHAGALCQTSATGGVTWLVQYTGALDSDLTCPVLNAVPGRHNALWQFRNTTQQLFSHGAAVSALQQAIGVPVSGSYDAATAVEVGTWQRSKQLPTTGKITPTDWRAMGAYRLIGGHPFWLSRIASFTS